MYQNKLQEQRIQVIVKRNKIQFELHSDLVDQAFSGFNEKSIKNQEANNQIENDETPKAKYSIKNDFED